MAIPAGCNPPCRSKRQRRPGRDYASLRGTRPGKSSRVISRAFHTWERRLASAATNRSVRPFEWGLDWLADHPSIPETDERFDPAGLLQTWGEQTTQVSERFYDVTPADDYALVDGVLTFTSAVDTPHPDNNLVRARYFPDPSERGRRRAVVVLPQWNANAEGHVGLCRLLNRFGISALRLSLPVSRCQNAARALARGLHRQLEHRTNGSSLPSGGPGRATRNCVAARGGVHVDRHPWDEPRLVSGDVDDGTRAAGACGGAEPHLTVFRGCRLGGAVHGAREAESRRQRHARRAAQDVAARSARCRSSSGSAAVRFCSCTRGTT